MSFAGASFAETPFASQGSLDVAIAVTGFGLTSTVGSVSVVAIANPNVSVTGVTASVTIGGSGVSAGGDAEISVVGQAIGITLGEEAVVVDSPNIILTGFGLTTTLGTATALSSTNPQPVGEEISSTLGTVTVEGVSNINVSVTGFGLNTTLNNSGIGITVSADAVISPLTLISTDLGNVSLQMNADVVISTGLPMTLSLSDTTAIYAWRPVDDSVTTIWTPVDDNATMTWKKVA